MLLRLFTLILLLSPFGIQAQCFNRYAQEIFSTSNKTADIVYGESINYNGDTVTLLLDFYEPMGDVLSNRPLIILLHGSNFVEGSKDNAPTVAMAQKLTKRGFAVAAVNYRTAFSMQTLLYKKDVFRASLQAAQDAKAAVRFFKENLQNGNSYGIDSNMIWLGGIGAGSMAAQMAVYLDDTLEVSSEWQTIIQTEGGLEGNSGNLGYSSAVRGVINLSGAILDSSWMNNNTEPLINIHGDLDMYYPYASDSLFAYTHQSICNGHHELCYKRLNEATFVQTHNSHANDSDFSILAANQNGDIPAQFAAGVRGLGIKLYYTSSFFCSGGTDLYAYHGDPFLGCIKFSTIGAQILSFLNANPNEFLFITVEGSASNTEIANGFQSAGLTPFLYQHTLGEIWPTIGELITSGKRLIVMTDNSGPSLPGYHHMWSFMQDTEYNFQSTGDFNCNYLRGNQNSDLFLLNHFLTVASPQPLSANSTNDWNLVLNRARQCGAARGLHPNLLYIDFFDSGDVFRAADTLNRIGEDFPLVHGSSIIHNQATQQGILSALYTINGEGYAPYSSNLGDSAAAFIADFMIQHFPCEMSCAIPATQIIGQDSIWKDSVYTYSINSNQGANYQWISPDSVYSNNSMIDIVAKDTSNSFSLQVIETSQYGCVYDTISLNIAVFNNTSIRTLQNQEEFWVYPNPANNELWLRLDNKIQAPYSIEIYDYLGKLLIQNEVQNNPTKLDIQSLDNGIYLIKIKTKEAEFVTKFTKVK